MTDAIRLRRRSRKPLSTRNIEPVVRSACAFALEPVERRVLLASVSGNFFLDHDGDGVRDLEDGGLQNWGVFLDANQNGTFDGSSTNLASSDVPKSVPDPGTVFSNLDVSGVGTISKVTVTLTITTGWAADIDIWLNSPTGTRIELSTDNGGSGDNYINTTFDDDAPTAITAGTAPFTGVFRPEQPLAGFIGQNADGQWRLEVADDLSGFPGMLNSWSLTFSSGERSTVSAANGNYTFLNVAAGTYDVRQVDQAGWNQTAPPGGFHTVVLDATTNATNLDFGNRQPPGSISGFVFSDYDSDGVRDPNEAGLPGWTVYLDLNDNAVKEANEPSRVTAADGSYSFGDLQPRQYVVREILQQGYVQTLPGSGGVILDGRPGGAGAGGNGAGAGAGGAATDGGTTDDGGGTTDDGGGRRFTSTEIVVAFKGNSGRGALRQQLDRDRSLARLVDYGNSRDMFKVNNSTLVEVKLRAGVDPLRAVEAFQRLGAVKWAQVNYIYDDFDPREFTPNDPQYASQYHHPLMKNNLAWDTTLGSPDILIGITDDGFLMNHPDLVDNYFTNPGEIAGNGVDDDGNGFIDDVRGWDFWTNDNDPNPGSAGNDHGTHVAGIAAARTNNAIGVAGTAGGSTIVPIRFYSTSGGTWTSTIVSNAYHYATDVGCNIVTTSYNVDGFSNDMIFSNALDYMYAGGVLHFNSGGNTGAANPSRQKWDHTLYVINTNASDQKVSSSAWGWGLDVAAPGNSILSTSIGSTLNDPNYELKTGTSMASPNAAGVAALIWSANPTWTREQVAAQLLGTADNIDAQNPTLVGLLGAGRVNSFRGVTETILPPKLKSLVGLPAEGGTVLTKPASFTLDVANVFDPATMNAGTFEMRGSGIDGVFGNGDDQIIPLNLVFGGASAANYKLGTNRLFFSIPGPMGSDTYRFTMHATATDPFGQSLDGNGDGTGGDAFTRTFILQGPTNPYRVNLDPDEHVVNVNFGNHDRVPPQVLASSFAFLNSQAIVVQFNEDVQASLDVGDLELENVTTGLPVSTAGFSLSYDSVTHTATFNVNGILPDGNYTATLSGTGIADPSTNQLDGDGNGVGGDDYSFAFFFLQGDANRDRVVNLDDFNALAANFGQNGTDFSQANFNYDAGTNLDDFNILAAQFGKSLPALDATGSVAAAGTTSVKGSTGGSLVAGGSLVTGGSPLTTRRTGATEMFGQTRIGQLRLPGQRSATDVLLDEQTGQLVLA